MSLAREAQAGLQAGMVASIQALNHGIIAFAGVGAAGVAYGMSAGLAVSGAAAIAMALIAHSRPLVGTTTAASAIIVGAVIASAGPETLAQAIAIALAMVAIAGALVVTLAATGLARITAMMPAAVNQGLRNATAAMVTLSVLPLLIGGAPGAGWIMPDPGATAVAAIAIAIMLRPIRGLPGPVVALVAATLAHHALSAAGVAVGPEISHLLSPGDLAREVVAGWQALVSSPPPLALALAGAATIALLSSTETLSASAALREVSGKRTEYGRDLLGAGAGMLASAGLGGVPASGLTVPTITGWMAGGRARTAQVCGAMVPFALLLIGGPLLSQVPLSGLAAVLVGAVIRLVELPASPFVSGRGRARRLSDAAISLSVLATAILFGLLASVGVGVLVAVTVFTASMARSPIRRAYRNPVGRSQVRRRIEMEMRLRSGGEAIALLELEGPLFFGSADHVLHRVEAEFASGAKVVVLEMSRITHIDMSGGRRLLEACAVAPGRVLLAPMHGTSRAAAELDALGLTVILPPSAICFDLASAVERAEAIILDRDTAAGPGQEVDPAFAFEALGLPSDAVGPILALTTRTFFADGEPIIRSGDPSDAAYLLLSGEVLISIGTGGDKPAARLAVLEPGVLFGEAALLGQVCRTADATARGDASCLRIDGRLVERLRQQHPELAWHITAMLARQLTTHLRTANMTIAKLET